MIAPSCSILVLCRYFATGWVKAVTVKVFLPVCLVATNVTSSMVVNRKPYKIWAAVIKDSSGSWWRDCQHLLHLHCRVTTEPVPDIKQILWDSCERKEYECTYSKVVVRTGLTKPSCISRSSLRDIPHSSIVLPGVPTEKLIWKHDQYSKQYHAWHGWQ